MESAFDVRARLSAPFLRGQGFEIGAGASPQKLPAGATCRYVDKRDVGELKELFHADITYKPAALDEAVRDADFIIAHHVLEHCADPIGVLMDWHRRVRDGGVCVMALPNMNDCADRGRVAPPIEHLVLDYLLERGDTAFESKEHIYSFLLGWRGETWFGNYPAEQFAANVQAEGRRDAGHDLHWHAFTPELAGQTVTAALRLARHGAELLAYAGADGAQKTHGETLFVYRLQHDLPAPVGFPHDCEAQLQALRAALTRAMTLLP